MTCPPFRQLSRYTAVFQEKKKLSANTMIKPVKPMIVSMTVHDFNVSFSDISNNWLTSQKPESFT